MLSDRSYMRSDYEQPKTSVLVWLIVVIVAAFILQMVFLRWFGAGQGFMSAFAVTIEGLKSGKVWTLFTYSFLHSTDNLLHIVGNLLGLYFIGRVLLPVMGDKRFLYFFGAAVVAGGLVWTATHWMNSSSQPYREYLVGASAGVTGLFIIFASLYPNQQITFLLFFIIPVSLKPKHMAYGLIGLDLLGFLFYEVMGAVSPFGFAHSAHLGGMLTGWLYYRYVHSGKFSFPGTETSFELPTWAKKKSASVSPKYKVNVGNQTDLKAEVDRILDKINSKGFGSLTAAEKKVLDDARDNLSRR